MGLSRLKEVLRLKPPEGNPEVPAGLRLYVIGDVHGRLDLLEDLAVRVSADLATAPSEVLTIFVGDYIDRGKDSAPVVGRLSKGEFPSPICALRGNHEEILLKFLEDESVLEGWRKYGALETLHSYGVNVSDVMRGRGYDAARKNLLERMPGSHRRFYEETRLCASFGDYFFAHAGVRPGVSLERQRADDLLWIRQDFLDYRGRLDKVVVHGHTPVDAPDVRPFRINVDTGAFATSVLTALVLEGKERRFLQTRAP